MHKGAVIKANWRILASFCTFVFILLLPFVLKIVWGWRERLQRSKASGFGTSLEKVNKSASLMLWAEHYHFISMYKVSLAGH